jgi:C4-dicarboxylate transporter DctQ subunit
MIDRVARALELALAALFIFAVLLNFSNVVGRYLFRRSILWADEIEVFIMVGMTFLGVIVVTWRREHLRMDALSRLLPDKAQSALRALELLVTAGLCGFVFWQSWDYTQRMFMIGRVSDQAGLPMWIPHASLAVGFGGIFLVCLWHGWRAARPLTTRDGEAR